MGKVKQYIRNLPLLPSFMLLVVFFILLAILFVEFERTAIRNAQYTIAFQYSDIVEGFNSFKVWAKDTVYLLSKSHSNLMQFCELLNWILPPITYVFCLLLAGIIFFKSKFHRPLKLLTVAAYKISNGDLDFSLLYEKNDQMGQLCTIFEKMRSTLEINNREMWRQIDERKRLNAAFSHDLRTPLTVLEGHLNILQKYTPDSKLSIDEIADTYTVMENQIARLKNYVVSMNTLQRIEDIPIVVNSMDTADLLRELKDTAEIICTNKQLFFYNEVYVDTLVLDVEIVMQVFENLLSNAVRYAKMSIYVLCKIQHSTFIISVTDDGMGFDKEALKSATEPFYTTEKNVDQHFGIGLNICKILCLRHNGNIALDVSASGGASVTVTFDMGKI